MKSFQTAAVDAVAEQEREDKIKALMLGQRDPNDETKWLKEPKSRLAAEAEVDEESFVEFEFAGRKMIAYTPTPGQLTFMLAAMGRGQSKDSRFASVVNIMLESLDEDSQDYLERRMLSRKRGEKLDLKDLEEVFEWLVEEWFSNPTQE